MESIINKLQRPNSSKLSRIDDIAGIRIIVNNINEIYKVSKLLDDLLINDFLFEEDFEGWYLGPINKLVRKEYKFIKMGKEDISLKDIEKKIIDRVFDRYKDMDSYKLSNLSHKEYSWIKSRIGLKRGEKGNQKLLKEDIKIDAGRYKKQLIADKKEELLEI